MGHSCAALLHTAPRHSCGVSSGATVFLRLLACLLVMRVIPGSLCTVTPLLRCASRSLFNEPWDTTWPVWKGFVERVGGRLLGICSRWLIAVQGAGQANQMCWGEDIRGQYYEPIVLPVADRLVFAPHTYGHFNFGYLIYSPYFPYNLPGVWDGNWGWIMETGPPLLLGEWGESYTSHAHRTPALRSASLGNEPRSVRKRRCMAPF